MKPKNHVVRLAELWTWSIGAEGRVLKAGPGTVTSAVAAGTGVPTSTGAVVGWSVGTVWAAGGTKVLWVGVGVVWTGFGVGLGVGFGLGVGEGGGAGVGMHEVGSEAQPANATDGVPSSAATTANSKKPLTHRISPKSLHRNESAASCDGSRVLTPQDL